jgi:hypothetical protein
VFSVLSALSDRSVLSALSRGSIAGWRSTGPSPADDRSDGSHQQRTPRDWLPFGVP